MPEAIFVGAFGALTVQSPSGLWLAALEERLSPFLPREASSSAGSGKATVATDLQYLVVPSASLRQEFERFRERKQHRATRGPTIGSKLYVAQHRGTSPGFAGYEAFLLTTGSLYSVRIDGARGRAEVRGPEGEVQQDRIIFFVAQQLYRAAAAHRLHAVACEHASVGLFSGASQKSGWLVLSPARQPRSRARFSRFVALQMAQHPEAKVAALDSGLLVLDSNQLASGAIPLTLRIDSQVRKEPLFKQRSHQRVKEELRALLSDEPMHGTQRTRLRAQTAVELFDLRTTPKVNISHVLVVEDGLPPGAVVPLAKKRAQELVEAAIRLPTDSLEHRGDFLRLGLAEAKAAQQEALTKKLLSLPWCKTSPKLNEPVSGALSKWSKAAAVPR